MAPMKTQLLIAGLLCSTLALGLALTGGPALLAVFVLGVGVGLKVAFLFGV